MLIKEFAEKYIKASNEAWQKGNFAPLEALRDPNIVYHLVFQGYVVGSEAIKQVVLSIRLAVPDFLPVWKYLTGDGNVFALSYVAHFTSPGPRIPKGKKVKEDCMFVLRLENGKVIEVWENLRQTVSDPWLM